MVVPDVVVLGVGALDRTETPSVSYHTSECAVIAVAERAVAVWS